MQPISGVNAVCLAFLCCALTALCWYAWKWALESRGLFTRLMLMFWGAVSGVLAWLIWRTYL